MFKLEIKTGGSAYRDEDGNLDHGNYELIRNLKEVIKYLEMGYESKSIIDINGNKVGSWSLKD